MRGAGTAVPGGIGRVASARIRILASQVDEGLERLDEIGVVLMSGEVDPLTTGMMYCELICAAQGLARHDRPGSGEVMERWRHGAAIGGINGRCRVHCAELLRISGPCDLAEAEALRACEELRPWMRREFGWPLVEPGTIRLRKGDLARAEEAFVAADERAWSPHPGLALLRWAQGDVDSASALIAGAIAHPFATPSKERPPFGNLRLAPLLDAQAEIAAAAGDVDTARRAADQLASIAASYHSRAIDACAALAGARAALIDGELAHAIDGATTALETWSDIGAPFETAVSRMVLGDAHHRFGNIDAARTEWQAARDTFTAFGAQWWAQRAETLVAQTPLPPAATTTPNRPAVNAMFRWAATAARRRVQNEIIGHRGRKPDPLYRARRLLTIAPERLPDEHHERLVGLLAAGDPRGEVKLAWHAGYRIRGRQGDLRPHRSRAGRSLGR